MRSCLIVAALLFSFQRYHSKVWTEEDEARRIQQIMESERLQFEREQNQQVALSDGNKQRLYSDERSQSLIGERLPKVQPKSRQKSQVSSEGDHNWCYYCASPLSAISLNLRRAIMQFLKMRRSAYPDKAVNPRCASPKNASELATQKCVQPYCSTLMVIDYEAGSSFAIRGCAESIGAMTDNVLIQREDNTCLRLHDDIDIQECICRHRKFCYPGAQRTILLGDLSVNCALCSLPQNLVFVTALIIPILHRIL